VCRDAPSGTVEGVPMTITVAVTGGIGAGKSTVSASLAERGAVVIDSDRLARDVVARGTPGLAAVAERFGTGVMAADGTLDRAALAAIVFVDPIARKALEDITHPLVRARFAAARSVAPPGSVVVNDIPLLRTPADAAAFHLVIGVGAPADVRVERLVGRGLSAVDARARIAAQIDDEVRRALCDVWIDNGSSPSQTRRHVEALWPRLAGFAANQQAGRAAVRGGPQLVPYDPEWPRIARRVIARVQAVVGDRRVDHIGTTAVHGLPATDVIDLQLTVSDLAEAEALVLPLAEAGFPRVAGDITDTPCSLPSDGNGSNEARVDRWRKVLLVNADPGLDINLHLRVRDWPNWSWSLSFRDWLRTDAAARADYLAVKEQSELVHGQDSDVSGCAGAMEKFLAQADSRVRLWTRSTGWTPG
jgi:dephospho-CoA kinase